MTPGHLHHGTGAELRHPQWHGKLPRQQVELLPAEVSVVVPIVTIKTGIFDVDIKSAR